MFYDMDSHHSVFLQEKFFIPLTCGKVKRKNSPITIACYFFLTFLLEEERLTLEREELEGCARGADGGERARGDEADARGRRRRGAGLHLAPL